MKPLQVTTQTLTRGMTRGSHTWQSTSEVNGQCPNLAEFIKGFIKLRNQMCELNYKGTKIEIGVKLGDQNRNWSKIGRPKVQFYLQKMKHLQGITQTLTRGIDTWH